MFFEYSGALGYIRLRQWLVVWREERRRFASLLLPRPLLLLCRLTEAEEKETTVLRVPRAVAAVVTWRGASLPF